MLPELEGDKALSIIADIRNARHFSGSLLSLTDKSVSIVLCRQSQGAESTAVPVQASRSQGG
jgi:phage terminase large subunit-like protein